MAPPIIEVANGDLITAQRANDVKDYIEDGTYRVNTLALEIGGTAVITSARAITNIISIAVTATATTGNVIGVTANTLTTGAILSLTQAISASGLTNRGTSDNFADLEISRTETRTSGTTADDFDVFSIKRTSIMNGSGGTLTAAGSVLKLENVATETLGTLTDTVSVLELVQDADSSGAGLKITNNGTGPDINAANWSVTQAGAPTFTGAITAALSSGDIIVGSAGNVTVGVTMSGDVTIANDGVTTISGNAVNGSMIAMGSDVQGDFMFYGGTDYERIGAGTSGQFLQTKGTSADPEWADSVPGGVNLVTDGRINQITILDMTSSITGGTISLITDYIRIVSGTSGTSYWSLSADTYQERDIEFKIIFNRVAGTDQVAGFMTGNLGNGAYYFLNGGGTDDLRTDQTGSTDTTVSFADGTEKVCRIAWTPGQVEFFLNGSSVATHSTNIPTGSHTIEFLTRRQSGDGSNLDVKSVQLLDL